MLKNILHTACDIILFSIFCSIRSHLFSISIKNIKILGYLEMVLFIEEDCGRATSKVAERRKIEKGTHTDAPEYRIGCHHRAVLFNSWKFHVMYQAEITNIAR